MSGPAIFRRSAGQRQQAGPPSADQLGTLGAAEVPGHGPPASGSPEPAGLVEKLDSFVERLDSLVTPVAEPENRVLADDTRIVRWAGPAFILFSLIMVPWTAYIAASLPTRQLSPNYDLAWAGFDAMLLCALGATGFFALRRSRYLSSAATAAAVLLVVDAWFDIMTTPFPARWESIMLAAVVELPLAAVCLWLSHRTHQLAGRRMILLLRRRRRDGRALARRDRGKGASDR